MLANSSNILQMCSFDTNKSTKGASKLRRDLINAEIANLRDLLPLPSSTRQRLSQLQLMALVCVYVRKANYFQHVFRKHDLPQETPMPHFGFSKALSGFLMMMTQNGKLLYISDNAAEYLGHSMEDLLIHGDSVYDIIEKQDHQAIQAELMRSPNPLSLVPDTRMFLCRMNVSRNARRQMRFGDQKVVLVDGHFVSFLPLCSRNEPVFLATCTPVAMPETRECVVQGSTNVFTSIHSMDMKFLHIDRNGEFHLGYSKTSLQGVSWYELMHWEHLREAQSKHRLITQSDQERSCIILLKLQASSGSWVWAHVVLQIKDGADSSQQSVIVCTNQVLSEREASVMRANSWLYQYYSLHSKMHYGLAYEAHATRLPTYYSTMMPYHHPPPPPTEAAVPHSPYHLHPPGGPLNGSSQHPPVLQYGGPHHQSNLPVPYTSITSDGDGTRWHSLKRPASPDRPESSPDKRPNFTKPNYSYPSPALGPGLTPPVPVGEIATVLPPSGYYGSTQVFAAVSYSHLVSFRTQKQMATDEEATDVEHSLTPTNTEDVSNMISFTNHHRYPRAPSYLPSALSSVLSESSRVLADCTEDAFRRGIEFGGVGDIRNHPVSPGETGVKRESRLASGLDVPPYMRYGTRFSESYPLVDLSNTSDTRRRYFLSPDRPPKSDIRQGVWGVISPESSFTHLGSLQPSDGVSYGDHASVLASKSGSQHHHHHHPGGYLGASTHNFGTVESRTTPCEFQRRGSSDKVHDSSGGDGVPLCENSGVWSRPSTVSQQYPTDGPSLVSTSRRPSCTSSNPSPQGSSLSPGSSQAEC